MIDQRSTQLWFWMSTQLELPVDVSYSTLQRDEQTLKYLLNAASQSDMYPGAPQTSELHRALRGGDSCMTMSNLKKGGKTASFTGHVKPLDEIRLAGIKFSASVGNNI